MMSFPPRQLHLASGNAHKAEEFRALVAGAGLGVVIISARDSGGMPPVAEDTGTFTGNARKKAQALRARLPAGAWVLADDSGVCVDALGGAPGVESAYFAGPEGDGAANLRKLVQVMQGIPDDRRGAHFACVLFLAGPDGQEFVFEGRCNGHLGPEPRGGAGFGYDPLFVPEGESITFAELGDTVKNRLSHRARAWAKLAGWLREQPR
jgi:XTP/dITP diphosphohydrolase